MKRNTDAQPKGYRLFKSGKYKPFSTWIEEQTLNEFKELCAAEGLQINHCVTEALDLWNARERARQRPAKKKS